MRLLDNQWRYQEEVCQENSSPRKSQVVVFTCLIVYQFNKQDTSRSLVTFGGACRRAFELWRQPG